MRDEFLAIVPDSQKVTTDQVNVAPGPDVVNAFRGLAWLHRLSYVEMFTRLVDEEIIGLAMSGRLEDERALQRKHVTGEIQAATEERIV